MSSSIDLQPRDVVKLAFQYQQTEIVPYLLPITEKQTDLLSNYYGSRAWQGQVIQYIGWLTGVDNFLSLAGFENNPDGSEKDAFGCSWIMGTTQHLVGWPLQEDSIGNYRLPDLKAYYEAHLFRRWPTELQDSREQFRAIGHSFGLFERAWSLRGFENFLIDLATNEVFVEQLLEMITEWIMASIDLMAIAPIDAVFLTDDHAFQRGMLMGAQRWRRLFKPRWKRIYERIHHYGLYTVMHMCGDTSEVVPDLIEVGLDVMESCQPECMDIYKLKREYGRDIRFWGGLGAQSILPFGTPQQVAEETRRLKREMGAGGGYLLSPSKAPGPEVPIENIAAFVEAAEDISFSKIINGVHR